jgi:hypothetical protein
MDIVYGTFSVKNMFDKPFIRTFQENTVVKIKLITTLFIHLKK